MKYIWPKNNLKARLRVVSAVGMLMGGKVKKLRINGIARKIKLNKYISYLQFKFHSYSKVQLIY